MDNLIGKRSSVATGVVRAGDKIFICSLPKTNNLKHLELLRTEQVITEVEYGKMAGTGVVLGVRIAGFPLILNPTHYEVIQ